jgi:hypothetical protein
MKQDHRSGARARQRFGHPPPAQEPGLRFLLKADERFATAWQSFLPLGIEQSSTNPVDSLLSTDVRFGTHSGLKSDIGHVRNVHMQTSFNRLAGSNGPIPKVADWAMTNKLSSG